MGDPDRSDHCEWHFFVSQFSVQGNRGAIGVLIGAHALMLRVVHDPIPNNEFYRTNPIRTTL